MPKIPGLNPTSIDDFIDLGDGRFYIGDTKVKCATYYKYRKPFTDKIQAHSKRSRSIPKKFGQYLGLTGKGGKQRFSAISDSKWAQPLMERENSNNFYRRNFKVQGKTVREPTKWGNNYGSRAASKIPTVGVMDQQQFVKHLYLAIHQIPINADFLRVAIIHRAMIVFKTSFKMQKFHSAGTPKWHPLSPYTLAMRRRRYLSATKKAESNKEKKAIPIPGEKILIDTGKLSKGLKMDKKGYRIYTDPDVWYGFLHNEGRGRYWKGKKMIQRQFMGHSTYLDITHPFIDSIVTRYLFDSVFLSIAK